MILLAALVVLSRGCSTAFITHETLTPLARSRILYYSLVQVCEGREMEYGFCDGFCEVWNAYLRSVFNHDRRPSVGGLFVFVRVMEVLLSLLSLMLLRWLRSESTAILTAKIANSVISFEEMMRKCICA